VITGYATAAGTARFRARFARLVARGHYRKLGDLWVSSIGLGTHLGRTDQVTDDAYEAAILEALAGGVNVFDTAINYRYQRSERCLGRALARAFERGLARRDEIVVSTKGGFVPFDAEPPDDPETYIRQAYVDTGLLEPEEVAASAHSLRPAFLADQLARSRANLGLETVDLFYLHNPETQLESGAEAAGLERIRRAIGWTEEARTAGTVRAAGLATWNGLRVPPGSPGHLPLLGLVAPAAAERPIVAIQLPLNLAMPEALAAPTQEIEEASVPVLVAARFAGLAVFASASLLQGRLTDGLPPEIESVFSGLETDAQRALQFTRSAPGVTTALVGMSSAEHVRENLVLAQHEPATTEALQALFAGGVSG